MMNPKSDVDIEATLEKFRQWLKEARARSDDPVMREPSSNSGVQNGAREFGILDLVEEFTALRHELKLQTKSGRTLIDQSDATVAALRQAVDRIRAVDVKEAQTVWGAGKVLAEALADLDEALLRGEREIERARRQIADESLSRLESNLETLYRRRSWLKRRILRSYHHEVIEALRSDRPARHQMFDSFLEGYGLISKRLRRVLASEQIAHIPCEGKLVDPELMIVIEVVDEPRDRPGTVVDELRRGYTWKGRLIRCAEVQAVRGVATANARADHADTAQPEEELDEVGASIPRL
jgi:molecular chaperone GrpE